MIWLILGATLLAVVVTVAVIRLRHAQRTLNAILAEHHERMDNPNGTAHDGDADRSAPPSHRRHGRRSAVRANGGYDLHRRMSA